MLMEKNLLLAIVGMCNFNLQYFKQKVNIHIDNWIYAISVKISSCFMLMVSYLLFLLFISLLLIIFQNYFWTLYDYIFTPVRKMRKWAQLFYFWIQNMKLTSPNFYSPGFYLISFELKIWHSFSLFLLFLKFKNFFTYFKFRNFKNICFPNLSIFSEFKKFTIIPEFTY